ncbi:hypothetical protein A203_08615 [Chromobacterium violaceum]
MEEVVEKGWPEDVYPIIDFKTWPKITVDLTGEAFNSSITPRVMDSFLELQKNINRSFSYLIYDDTNANRLTDSDRREFEIVVKVSQGSSKFEIDFQEILEKFVSRVGDKVEGKHLVVIALFIALAYSGTTMYSAYLEEASKKNQSDITVEMSKQETERLKIISTIVNERPELKIVHEYAKDSHHSILKGASQANEAKILGVKMTGSDATTLTKSKRERSVEVRLDGEYRIKMVDTSNREQIKVKVQNQQREFIAIFEDDSLNAKEIALLKDKLISRETVLLQINATELRGHISQAEIVGIGQG